MPKFKLTIDVNDSVYRRAGSKELTTTFEVDPEDLEDLDEEQRHSTIAAIAEEAFWNFVGYDWTELDG